MLENHLDSEFTAEVMDFFLKWEEKTNIPVDALNYSDFIISKKWDGVDEDLRGIYKEAEEALGQEFPYPGDE